MEVAYVTQNGSNDAKIRLHRAARYHNALEIQLQRPVAPVHRSAAARSGKNSGQKVRVGVAGGMQAAVKRKRRLLQFKGGVVAAEVYAAQRSCARLRWPRWDHQKEAGRHLANRHALVAER